MTTTEPRARAVADSRRLYPATPEAAAIDRERRGP